MGKKVQKLQRVMDKLATRYGEEDVDVLRLQATLEALREDKQKLQERRRFGPSETAFLTPAKRLYYASLSEPLH